MADADILKSLREQVLDESESLAGLLRKCLVLGAVTGSDELRSWAKNELNGYPDDALAPEYRQLHAQLFIDTMMGTLHRTQQDIDRLQVPKDLRHFVPEKLHLKQPIEDLDTMANREKSCRFTAAGFPVATALWSSQLGPYQQVIGMYYVVLPSTIAAIVGRTRTTLVEIVIDLAKDVPLENLPSQAKVDSVVQVHIGSKDEYQVSVGTNSGIIGQGVKSTQNQTNSVPIELISLIAEMRESLADIDDPDQRADVEQVIDDFDEVVSEDAPEPEKIKRRSRALERMATAVGSAFMSQAAKDGVALAADHFHLLS